VSLIVCLFACFSLQVNCCLPRLKRSKEAPSRTAR
jgi:hypothetical protein